MKKHFTRTLLIWGVLVVCLVLMYPTVGWMMLKDDPEYLALSDADREKAQPKPGTRQDRLVRWQKEDDEFARERHGSVAKFWHATKRWSEFDRNQVINLGLDLQGGIHMVLRFDYNELPAEKLKQYRDSKYTNAQIEKTVQDTVLQQIQRRVNDFEAKEPVIQALGTNQIQIQLPGEKNTNRARALITKTALLNFHIVNETDEMATVYKAINDKYPTEFAPFVKAPALRGEPFRLSVDNYDRVRRVIDKATAAGVIPKDKLLAFGKKPKAFEKQEYHLYLIDKEPIARGDGLKSSMALPDQQNPGSYEILFTMTNAAGAKFGDVTDKNKGRPMGIVVDGVVLSAPVIRDRITTNGQITGNFDGDEAHDLSIALNSGSMVVPVHEEFTRVVGPNLGADSVRSGTISTLITLIIVGGFMVTYYLWSGVVAMIGLVYCFIMIIGMMAYSKLTLTLPGIAGLILTIGMAVDANILIYERFREELRLGHALGSCIEAGFKRAATTILDANITTLIAAIMMMQFGTGPVQGFAVTLAIGIVATIFFSLVVCHGLFDFMLEHKIIKNKLTMMQAIPMNPGIRFIEIRNIGFVFSAITLLIGVGVFVFRGDAMYGVDFTSGTNINVALKSDQRVPVGDVRGALRDAGFKDPAVQEVGQGDVAHMNQFIIRVSDVDTKAEAAKETPAAAPAAPATPPSGSSEAEKAPEGSSAQSVVTVAERMQKALAPLTSAKAPEGVTIEDQQTVGPAVGKQLRRDAFWAVGLAFIFMILYLWVRYDWKFGIMGVVALFHDTIFAAGMMAILGRKIDMTVVAALLTIIGYSINDTVVVYDRIREERALLRGKGYTWMQIMNVAINVTLSRTVLTSMTVFFSVVVLYFFGGDSIKDFALTLIIGVLIGTYSSIFVASALVYEVNALMDWYRERKDAQAQQGRRRPPSKPGKSKTEGAPA